MAFRKIKPHRTPVELSRENIEKWYGKFFGAIERVEPQQSGKTNDVVKIFYNGQVAYLKAYNDSFEDRAETEVYARKKFGSIVPIPQVLLTDFSEVRTPRKIVVFAPAEGIQMDANISEAQLDALLEVRRHMDGQRHTTHGNITPNAVNNLGYKGHREFIDEVVDAAVSRNKSLHDLQKKYMRKMDRVTIENPSLVHQSFNHKHVFFNGNQVSGFIDWEAPAFSDRHIDYASLYVSLAELKAHDRMKQLIERVKRIAQWESFTAFVARQYIIDAGFKHGMSAEQAAQKARDILDGKV